MFKINLRSLLRVLFILGLLLPTYVLPSSSTSSVAFAEGEVEKVEVLEAEERGGQCQRQVICIRRIQKPDLGQEMGKRLLLAGRFPEGMLEVTVRNPQNEVVYDELMLHDGRNRVRVNLGKYFQWQAGSHTVTVMLANRLAGDSFDLDVKESDGRFIRDNGGAVDIEKMVEPDIGELMRNQLKLTGNFPRGTLNVTLLNSNGEVVYESLIDHDGSRQLPINLRQVDWTEGTYEIRIESVGNSRKGVQQQNRLLLNGGGNPFDSFHFGVDYGPNGCRRIW